LFSCSEIFPWKMTTTRERGRKIFHDEKKGQAS
jgi:hypothetical protein